MTENNTKTLTISFENHTALCTLKLALQEETKGKGRIDFDIVLEYLRTTHDPAKLKHYALGLIKHKKGTT